MKILNGNFPMVWGFPYLPFRTKSCQGQAGVGDRPCCMGSKQKDKRQMSQYFVLGSFRLRLQTRPYICVWRAISRSTPKGPVSPRGSSIVPLGRKKSGCFSVGPCHFFLFTHPCSLHFCSRWETSEMVFSSEGRWTRMLLFLVQGCSQEHFFLLVSWLVDTKEGTFPFACCLRKYCSTDGCSLQQIYGLREIFWVLSHERWSQKCDGWLPRVVFIMCIQSSEVALQKLLSGFNFCGFAFLTEISRLISFKEEFPPALIPSFKWPKEKFVAVEIKIETSKCIA